MDSFCITTLGTCQFPPLAILLCEDEVQLIFSPFYKDECSGIEAVVTSSVGLFNSFSFRVKSLDWKFLFYKSVALNSELLPALRVVSQSSVGTKIRQFFNFKSKLLSTSSFQYCASVLKTQGRWTFLPQLH